ncbi:MAG: trigger factor [Rhodothermia bacterium]|nr:trigger factor [Rhodothermia bacterium]
MRTSINKVTPVEFELEINATADDLKEDFHSQLRAQRARTVLKGFRKGKVPLSLVKKMYGRELAFGVAEKSIQQTYESEVMQPGEHEVLGQPKITVLDYEMDGDLRAVIRFGVRPQFDVKYPKRESVSKLVHEVTEEEIDHEIEHLQESAADLAPVEGEPVGEDDFVLVDLQKIDAASGAPLIGEKREDATFYLGDERLRAEFRDPIVGASAGDTVRVSIPPSDEDEDKTVTAYQITVKEIKRKDLPVLDDDFAKEVSQGQVETIEALRDQIRERLVSSWQQRSRELFESKVVEKIVALNEIEIPESVVEMYLDAFVEELKKNREQELPEGFDEQAYREAREDEAVHQARWMLVKDRIVEEQNLEVSEADRDAFFEKSAADGEVSSDLLKQYYSSVSGLIERLDQRLLTEKVIDFLSDKFKVVEKDRTAFEKEMEKQAKKEAKEIEKEAKKEAKKAKKK